MSSLSDTAARLAALRAERTLPGSVAPTAKLADLQDFGTNPGALGASGRNYDAGIVKMHNGAPGWQIGTSSTVMTDVKGDTYCATGCAWSRSRCA